MLYLPELGHEGRRRLGFVLYRQCYRQFRVDGDAEQYWSGLRTAAEVVVGQHRQKAQSSVERRLFQRV